MADDGWRDATCSRCGVVSPHLRYALFYRVWSIVVYSQRTTVGGVLCPACRSRFAAMTALFTGCLGPWGIPFGILYSLHSLCTSIMGGEMKAAPNAALLKRVGATFALHGRWNESRTAFTDSLAFEPDVDVATIIAAPEFATARLLPPPPRWAPGQLVGVASLVLPFALFLSLGAILLVTDPSAR